MLDIFVPEAQKNAWDISPNVTNKELEHLATSPDDYIKKMEELKFY
jgi:hypothetical protein